MPTWPSTLPAPLLSGHQMAAVDAVARTQMDSGPARGRRRYTRAPVRVTASWSLTALQADIFRAWWKHEADDGAASFTLSLRAGASFETVTARAAGPWALAPAGAGRYALSLEIEVEQFATMTAADLAPYL